jgi:uncharacterized protein (DUF2147 family)
MKHITRWFILLLVLFVYAPFTIAGASPVGKWITIDDKTNKKRAEVSLELINGQLHGKILHIYSQAGDTGVCTKCPGKFKGKRIEGLQFMWGLKDKGHGIWVGGHILDAKTGKIYNAKLKVDGNKLYVRGYVGMSLLGRTQIWTKTK